MADGSVDDDDDLIAGFAGGDRGAFAALMRRHQGRSLHYARCFFAGGADAEDAVQAAFIQLHGLLRTGRYDARGRFRAYLARIVTNQCLMLARSSTSFSRLRDGQPPPGNAATPLDALADRQRGARLHAALAELDDERRSVALMHYLEDSSVREIADALRRPEGTVKRWLSEARASLREILKEENA